MQPISINNQTAKNLFVLPDGVYQLSKKDGKQYLLILSREVITVYTGKNLLEGKEIWQGPIDSFADLYILPGETATVTARPDLKDQALSAGKGMVIAAGAAVALVLFLLLRK